MPFRVVTRVTVLTSAGLLMTSCFWSEKRFVPQSQKVYVPAQRTLARLQARINAGDAEGICALYTPNAVSVRCPSVWRVRLRGLRTPVKLSMRKITWGCDGDGRVIYVERSPAGRRLRTLSVVDSAAANGVYDLLIDVPTSSRP